MKDTDLRLLLLLLLGAGAAGATWYFWNDLRPPTEPPAITSSSPPLAAAPEPLAPLHPVTPTISVSQDTGELIPLPALDESDAYFLLELTDLYGERLERLLVNEALIDKIVASVDNLMRAEVSEKIRPLDRLGGSFVVDAEGEHGPFWLSPANHERYDLLVSVATSVDPSAVADTYRRFYPLMQQSYERLGYPNAYFNDRVVEVIDHLLETPSPTEPIPLAQPHVLYEFTDPELEALSSGQKLLIRMGSEHGARIRKALAELRVHIARSE